MSVQIFLHGKLLGIEEFLLAPAQGDADSQFIGRSQWVGLLAEVLPRALLAEQGLARILLGASGGGQFLLVLPQESRHPAEDFLSTAADQIADLSGGVLRLVWAITENLGDWSDVRKRLGDESERWRGAPGFFGVAPPSVEAEEYFAGLCAGLRSAESVGWSPETGARVSLGRGKHTWSLTASGDALPMARHAAPSDEGFDPASTAVLAGRAEGHQVWGVLRGDVDNFSIRLRRLTSIEEHIQISVMYKQFFAGELEVLCSMPEFWRKVTVLYSGGDDFAVYGAWDALIPLARELQRLFHRFSEGPLKDFPGAEGKTISMALALAPALDASLAAVYEEAGARLEMAKSANKDCIWLLGRTLEWRQFGEASELKDSLIRMVAEYGCSPQYLRDLCSIYRETQSKMSKRQARRMGGERPWRYHRRIRRILGASLEGSAVPRSASRDYQRARQSLIEDLIGRSGVTVKLRPAGRVALEWARLASEV
jgi:CRISPR-associated protein Csm1